MAQAQRSSDSQIQVSPIFATSSEESHGRLLRHQAHADDHHDDRDDSCTAGSSGRPTSRRRGIGCADRARRGRRRADEWPHGEDRGQQVEEEQQLEHAPNLANPQVRRPSSLAPRQPGAASVTHRVRRVPRSAPWHSASPTSSRSGSTSRRGSRPTTSSRSPRTARTPSALCVAAAESPELTADHSTGARQVRRWKAHSPSGRCRRSKRVSWARRWWWPHRGRPLSRSVGPPLAQARRWWWISHQAKGRCAAGDGAGVVEQGQGAALGAGVQAAGAAEVQGHRVAVEDGGDEPGVAGQPAGLAGGDRDPGVEPGGAEPGEQGVEVDRDQHLAAVAAVAGPAAGGQVLDQLAPARRRGSRRCSRPSRVPGADSSTHQVAVPVAAQPAGCGEPVQRRVRRWPWSSGIRNLPGVGAVAVVVQGQEGLGLGGAGLPAQQDRLVPVGQVGVDGGEHPPGGLPQPLGVHAAARTGSRPRWPWPPATPRPRAPARRWPRPGPARRR